MDLLPVDDGEGDSAAIVELVFPAGLALAVAAILVQFGSEGLLGRPIEEARTLVSVTIVLTGLAFVVEVVGFEEASWRDIRRPVLTFALAGTLFGAMVLSLQVGFLRDFFVFTEVSWIGWATVVVASATALAARWGVSRYWRQVVALLTAQPGPEEAPRGRQA